MSEHVRNADSTWGQITSEVMKMVLEYAEEGREVEKTLLRRDQSLNEVQEAGEIVRDHYAKVEENKAWNAVYDMHEEAIEDNRLVDFMNSRGFDGAAMIEDPEAIKGGVRIPSSHCGV